MLQRYTVDLAGMHALYEWNYARLQKLLRGAGVHEWLGPVSPLEFEWMLPGDADPDVPADAAADQPVLQLARVERTRYTETWRLAQLTRTMPWCPELDMEVRLYHDARMADVLRFQTARRIPAVVPAAHPAGWRINEKQLVNRFLGDCLGHCLTHGLPRDPRLQPDYSAWDAPSAWSAPADCNDTEEDREPENVQ